MRKTKIIIPRGSSYELTLLLSDTSGERFSDPTAIVTAYAKRTIEQDYYDIELTGIYTDGSDGAVWVFMFQPNTTEQLAPGQYFFEIRVDGTDDDDIYYSYVAVSVCDVEFYIGYSVMSPTEEESPIPSESVC